MSKNIAENTAEKNTAERNTANAAAANANATNADKAAKNAAKQPESIISVFNFKEKEDSAAPDSPSDSPSDSSAENKTFADSKTFTGKSIYFPTGKVYGGQVIAQSLVAAYKTVEDDRLPNSVHGYFMKPGDIKQELDFEVENLRDGRSLSARRVNATQRNGAIFTAIASFQKDNQSGVEFQDKMPQNLPEPEELTSAKQLMEPYAQYSPMANYYATRSPFDIRHVGNSVMLAKDDKSAQEDSGKQIVWMKADEQINAGQIYHRALLALGCDQIMMEPVVRRAGLSFATKGIFYATIDHSMWWYDSIDINEWHLYVQDTPKAGHGRGLGTAKVYDKSGKLVACMVQEAMIRVPEK